MQRGAEAFQPVETEDDDGAEVSQSMWSGQALSIEGDGEHDERVDALQLYLRDLYLRSQPPLSHKEDREILGQLKKAKSQETIQLLRRKLVERNLRLVVWVAKRYLGKGLDFLDLIQYGNEGLLKAARAYNPCKAEKCGNKFSTYAWWEIKAAIQKALMEYGSTVRLPVHRQEEIHFMERVIDFLRQELMRNPTVKEIGKEMARQADGDGNHVRMFTPRWIEELLLAARGRKTFSLHEPISVDDERTREDLFTDENQPSPENMILCRERQEMGSRILRTCVQNGVLSEEDADILRMRFYEDPPLTLAEIGEMNGYSREGIRLRQNLAREALCGFLQRNGISLANLF